MVELTETTATILGVIAIVVGFASCIFAVCVLCEFYEVRRKLIAMTSYFNLEYNRETQSFRKNDTSKAEIVE